ncbi:MAG: hypothetical protein WCJ29_03440 [bacterium]
MTMDIAGRVAQKIQQENIKPIPKTYFVARSILVWATIVVTVTLTGTVCGVMVYLLRGHDWGLRIISGDSLFHDVVTNLPYLWFLVAVLFLSLAVYGSRALKRGYSVRPSVYICLYGTIALLIGVAIAESGSGTIIEHEIAEFMPGYGSVVNRPENDWDRPEMGLIAGELRSSENGGVVLVDYKGHMWTFADVNAVWKCGSIRKVGNRVKFIGMMQPSGQFDVQSVLPWDVKLSGSGDCIRSRFMVPCGK